MTTHSVISIIVHIWHSKFLMEKTGGFEEKKKELRNRESFGACQVKPYRVYTAPAEACAHAEIT